ncbi:5-hydroxytryptamine receptor 1D [Drosophila novamexicana]|uniref:5-hydroxytryptamine receptor 1D n=1 Tax=Drosophila novamexicana TaxID=47314 RepID=UPI0011E5C413|nr:5-hydroxytryptamine receptor 1D [Drosophila novamexicana]XP_030568126.1 5-hydroxytryptamine receptor 1D [Drosophila novamexicana]
MNSSLKSLAWPKSIAVAIFLLLILVTVIGNMLVILAVLTTRRLRTVTNCFVMSLAVADLLVGIFVMPPAVALHVIGSWKLGWLLCEFWISFDILLCTASILSLCAISLDRYLAVTQPLTYSKKWRCKRLALLMILGVWLLAFVITCPPMLGWYEPGRNRHQTDFVDCRYNQNKGYVVYSAMGSFFIPLTVMLYVYVRIGYVLTSRRQRIVRDANSERTADHDLDGDNFILESEHYRCNLHKCLPCCEARCSVISTHVNPILSSNHVRCVKCQDTELGDKRMKLKHQPTFYELIEFSRMSTHNCKYHAKCASAFSIPALCYKENQCLAGTSLETAYNNGPNRSSTTLHQFQRQLASHRIPMRVSTKIKNTKTTKTLTIVMGGLIACWTPFFAYYLLIPFLPQLKKLESLMSFFTWVGWLNCAINPFIYAFNPDFRAAFWRLTFRRICKQKLTRNRMKLFRT